MSNETDIAASDEPLTPDADNLAREEILSPEETEALLQGIADGTVATSQGHGRPTGEMRLYDFSDCERLARGAMPTLGIINTRVARKLQDSLSELLRRPVEVETGIGRLVRFGEHMPSLPTPASLNLVRLRPLTGSVLIVPSYALVSLCVDCFFGGRGTIDDDTPAREFTAVEQRMVSLLLERFLDAFTSGWEPVLEIEPELIGQEQNPHFAAIANNANRVIVTDFEMQFGERGAALQIIMPRAMLDPVVEALDATPRSDDDDEQQRRWTQALRERFGHTHIEVGASLTEVTLHLKDVLAMAPGDVIAAELPDSIVLEASGTPLFTGRPGSARNRNAFEVMGPVDAGRQPKEGN